MVTLKLGKLQALAALTRHVELFARQAEPGLTAEERARYQAQIATRTSDWRNAVALQRQYARERDEALGALAAARATLAAGGLGLPSDPPREAEAPPAAPRQALSPRRRSRPARRAGRWKTTTILSRQTRHKTRRGLRPKNRARRSC